MHPGCWKASSTATAIGAFTCDSSRLLSMVPLGKEPLSWCHPIISTHGFAVHWLGEVEAKSSTGLYNPGCMMGDLTVYDTSVTCTSMILVVLGKALVGQRGIC